MNQNGIYNNPFNSPYGNPYGNLYGNPYKKNKGLTPAQKELLPYVKQAKAESDNQINWLQPLELIFDILSRGQYATANLGEDIGRMVSGEQGINPLEGMWKGITGERKGDWKTTLFGGQDKGESQNYSGWFKETPEWMKTEADIPIIGKTSWQDVFGFLANVALDPTSYISFGATKGAKQAANVYAKKTVLNTLKQAGNLDNLAKLAQKGFSKEKLASLIDNGLNLLSKGKEEGVQKALNYIQQYSKKMDMSRFMNDITVKAYKEGLQMTPELVQSNFTKNLLKDKSRFIDDTAKALAKDKAGKSKAIELANSMKKSGDFNMTELSTGYFDNLINTLNKKKLAGKDLEDVYKSLLEKGTEGLKATPGGKIGRSFDYLTDYSKQLKETGSKEFLEQFSGMGTRSFNLFGKELFSSVRQPWLPSRTWEALKEGLSKTKAGGMFKDVWWSVMNTGAVGKLKQLFGIRNPYQKILHVINLDNKHQFDFIANQKMTEVQSIFDGVDDKLKNNVRDVIGKAEAKNIRDISQIFDNPELMEKMGLKFEDANAVKTLTYKVKTITDQWKLIEDQIAKEGIIKEFGERANYLPVVSQNKFLQKKKARATGIYAPTSTHKKTFNFEEKIEQEKAVMQWLWGVDEESAKKMVTELNWSSTNMDLQEMLLHRAYGNAQIEANANLLRQFKEFGIELGSHSPQAAITKFDPFGEMNPADVQRNMPLFQKIKGKGFGIEDLGLSPASHEYFKGYLFDKDVANIINKVSDITSSDEGLNWFRKLLSGSSSWWKAMATLSPGFHLRNARSNTFNLFMKSGLRGISLKKGYESFIATSYALYGDGFLKKFKFADEHINKVLNRQVGGKSVKEWAVFAREKGIINKASMGFDIQSTVKAYTEKPRLSKAINPLSNDNILFKKSQSVGSVIESTPKFQSFLLDLEDMLKTGKTNNATDGMIDYAIAETRKWFFDYSDSTEFESKVMKQLMPFYTWLRKNIGLQVTQMLEKKEMYATTAKALRGITDDDVDPTELPSYMREEGWIPTGEGQDGKERMLHPNLPYEDINVMPFRFDINEAGIPIPKWEPQEILDEFMSSANPLIKTAFNILPGKGYDPFLKKDLEPQAPAPRVLRYLGASPQLLTIIDGMLKTAGIKEGLDVGVNKDGKMLINSKIAAVLENNFLVIRRLGDLESGITQIIPQIDEIMNRTTDFKNRYEGIDKVFKNLSFFFGITQKDIELDQEELYRYRKILEKAEEARKRDRKKLPGYTKRSSDYQKKERDKMRRLGLK